MHLMNLQSCAEMIYLAGVESVLPDRIIRNQMYFDSNNLQLGDYSFNVENYKNIYVVGAGKAAALMAKEVELILGEKITEGHVIVKYGSAITLNYIKITEAGHPIPDLNGFRATKEILSIASKTSSKDLVICLLSGGGSSLLTDYPEGSSLEDISNINNHLIRSGATIQEINTVRKHVSKVKGGQLAKNFYPSTVVTLVLSDVVGDSLEVISSGPTFPDDSTFLDAIAVINKYNLAHLVPVSIFNYLISGAQGKHDETPKKEELFFKNVFHILVGSNTIALKASFKKAIKLGFRTFIITHKLQGDCVEVSKYLLQTALKYQSKNNIKKPICLLFGGEPTLKVTGNGEGGRNQHLALLFAKLISDQHKITFLSAGTDGSDGPTLAAGAIVDTHTMELALSRNINPNEYLSEFDSYNFFKKVGGQIITGQTMTNVMDLMVILIE